MPPGPEAFRGVRVLTGPTGAGKSALALAIAERDGAEIIALDSMTLYRGMDVGTAKPTADERARVPHHLIDVLDPAESASVAWYLDRAAECVADIRRRGRIPLFVGGTPLYLKAMLFGIFESPPADFELRKRLEQLSPTELHSKLRDVDPASAERLHLNDTRRVVRALELFQTTGQRLSERQTQWGDSPTEIDAVCVDWPRSELYSRIDSRVLGMIAAGWLDEVRRLRGRPMSREAAAALGYADLERVLDGTLELAEAVRLIQQKSRNYAKRQMTWFRHLPGIRMIAPELTMDAWSSTMQAGQ